MTDYYVGPGGNDGNSGLTWALRKLTLNGAEDVPVAAGDTVYVGPGAYREMLTCDVSGGNTYVVGTVTVTADSDQVAGAGTAWLANVAAGYYLHVRHYASGNDGVTNGTPTFTSAAGNFQANMVGLPIQINTRGAYTVAGFTNPATITLSDPSGLGWPAAAAGLTYSVMSGEGHYEIESVDDNTTITLAQPWQGRTLTGLAYITFNAIKYIADVTGQDTDGVGGVVRLTGSDNDQTATRATCVDTNGQNYRSFRGFAVDTVTTRGVYVNNSAHVIVEDCAFSCTANQAVETIGASQLALTARRLGIFAVRTGLYVNHGATVDDSGHVFENCLLSAQNYGFFISRVGGMAVKNVSFLTGSWAMRVIVALVTGQTVYVTNSILTTCGIGMQATALGEITENYNDFAFNGTDRLNVAVGASSVAYTPLFAPPMLHAGADQLSGFGFPWRFGDLSRWSLLNLAGVDERNVDLWGVRRPATVSKDSWGAAQFADAQRDTATTHGGSTASLEMSDAGRAQFKIPVSGAQITVSVYVYREANYAGTAPQMVVKQPGQADRATTDAGAAGAWNQLTDTFTPAADPEYIFVELASNNTAVAGNYAVYFDDLTVDASPALGTFDDWFTDRLIFDEVAAAGGGAAAPILAPSTIVR